MEGNSPLSYGIRQSNERRSSVNSCASISRYSRSANQQEAFLGIPVRSAKDIMWYVIGNPKWANDFVLVFGIAAATPVCQIIPCFNVLHSLSQLARASPSLFTRGPCHSPQGRNECFTPCEVRLTSTVAAGEN